MTSIPPFWMLTVAMATHVKIFDSWLKHAMRGTRERAGIQSSQAHIKYPWAAEMSLSLFLSSHLAFSNGRWLAAIETCGWHWRRRRRQRQRERGERGKDAGEETREEVLFQWEKPRAWVMTTIMKANYGNTTQGHSQFEFVETNWFALKS